MPRSPTRAGRECRGIFFLKARERWPGLSSASPPLSPSCTQLFSNQSLNVWSTSFKDIKYKTLPYSIISNHSIYKFIFSKKKKCKRYSNSTQFKFFFSCLNFPKEEFQKRTLEQGYCPKGLLGSSTVHQFGVGLSRVTLARTFKCRRSWGLCSLEAKWIWNVRAELPHLRQSSTRPSPFRTRKLSSSEVTHPTFHAPSVCCPPEW